MWGHFGARGQIDTGPVRAALTGPAQLPVQGPCGPCIALLAGELIINAGATLKPWLRDFRFSCLRQLKIPKIWRRALIFAIPKPMKPMGDPKSYRSIFLVCVPYKILQLIVVNEFRNNWLSQVFYQIWLSLCLSYFSFLSVNTIAACFSAGVLWPLITFFN